MRNFKKAQTSLFLLAGQSGKIAGRYSRDKKTVLKGFATCMRLMELIELEPKNDAAPSAGNGRNAEYSLPEEIGILPIRSAVAYPGTVMPLAVGRERSKRLITDIAPQETIFGLLTQKNPDIEDPAPTDLYTVGTAASVLKVIRMPQGSVNIVVHGMMRFKVLRFTATEPYLKARVEPLPVQVKNTKKLQALMVSVRNTANRVIALSPNVPEEAALLLENIADPSALADFLAATLNISIAEKQALLEETDAYKRLEKISPALASQLEVLELSHKIQGQVRESIDKSQREYFLQEEMKAIQAELGQDDRRTQELKELQEKIEAAHMPPAVEAEARRELDRLGKTPPGSPDYGVIRTYLDWMCELPWAVQTDDRISIARARRILNQDHYGLDKVKRRILEFLAVRKLNPRGKAAILCFVGPPGVGKTSLGKSIARSMGRKFVRISLGGIRDEADIRGHRRTYIGALPGRILQELRKCGSKNPVFMLDELDKIGQDFRGDPASALLEVLDPEQNNTFTDHYLDLPFDLSNVMFIGTANYTEPIPPALMDRMEILQLAGYTKNEKLHIAKKYLIARQLKEHGLTPSQLTISDEALGVMIDSYTREAGVRNLERTIGSICRYVATQIAEGKRKQAAIRTQDLLTILGPPQFEPEVALRTAVAGVATGLAYTPAGGQILFVESVKMPGKGQLQLTGQIGEVMKESAQAAFSVLRSHAEALAIEPKVFSKYDFHIHVPAGAVPKDGPSAGVAIFTSLASLLKGIPVRPDVAMTGEITLQGLLLPIGGLKEKILAAKQAGIKTVILPQRNKKDMLEIPREAKSGMQFVYARSAAEVLKTALAAVVPQGGGQVPARRRQKKLQGKKTALPSKK
ncbi:MAG TPA: endopeptidase La [Anaerohalosphaeraceae bacterium]|nr:endopeptidase La [Anaerohalosphaeraceae bacterium]